jgi:hypothetical protein
LTARIAIIVEGATETAFKHPLTQFVADRLPGQMPHLRFFSADGRLPKGEFLRRDVARLLAHHDAVIALTDVYTGTQPHDFESAEDAKAKMRTWVGDEPRFHAHAAQYEFEAWLLPYWSRIQAMAGSRTRAPRRKPEHVNHDKPPSRHIEDAFRKGNRRHLYSKPRDATAILRGQDLAVAAIACPEMRAFLNTILIRSGGSPL